MISFNNLNAFLEVQEKFYAMLMTENQIHNLLPAIEKWNLYNPSDISILCSYGITKRQILEKLLEKQPKDNYTVEFQDFSKGTLHDSV